MFEDIRDIDEEIFYDNIVPDHKTSTDSDDQFVKQSPTLPDIINNIEEIENFLLNEGVDIFGISGQLNNCLEKIKEKRQLKITDFCI